MGQGVSPMGSVDGLVRGIIVSFRLGNKIKWFVEYFGDRDCDCECVERRSLAT